MKQVFYARTGGPDVLQVRDVPIPEPGRDEVLVRMIATSVNGVDLTLRRGDGRTKPLRRPRLTGVDVCGVVERAGAAVHGLKAGDLVWGNAGPDRGTATTQHPSTSSARSTSSLTPSGASRACCASTWARAGGWSRSPWCRRSSPP